MSIFYFLTEKSKNKILLWLWIDRNPLEFVGFKALKILI